MHAYVYKSLRKADTYVYLAQRDDFAPLPDAVRAQLGGLEFVLEVELTPERRLARVDVAQVRDALAGRGFFLQVPPPPDAAAYDAGEYYRSRDA
ncbi:YcgL domain-containing protein [Lysobacter xanthus]